MKSNKEQKLKERLAHSLLKPMDIKRMSRVPYQTVIQWIETGHPRAGILPSIDLAAPGKRHSYRIHPEAWAAFLACLSTPPKTRQHATPPPRPRDPEKKKSGLFHY